MKEKGTYHEGMEGINIPDTLRKTPFIVPDNYFAESASSIRSQINIEKIRSEDKIASLPADYFKNLKNKIIAQTKLEQYRESERAIWSVPENYFEELTEQLKTKAHIESVATKKDGFTVPEQYFDGLHSKIQTSLIESRLKEKVATSGFEVPEQYFSEAGKAIKAEIFKGSAEKKIIQAPIRRIGYQKWMDYAAAACLAAVLGVGSYLGLRQDNDSIMKESHLSAIPNDEIINYLASSTCSEDMYYLLEYTDHYHDSDGICRHVEEDDIKDYLNYML